MKNSRIVIAAPKSGSGKTLLTCGLLKVFTDRKLKVKSYKCGPDYIDPMFHKYILGVEGGNLDSWFSGEKEIRNRIVRETRDKDITVIEGVMGYYDGLGGNSTTASAYDIARITETPAVLIVDGKGMSLSVGALVKGFKEFRKDSRIAAVIANRTSPMMETRLRECVEETGCAFLGCLPENKDWKWESRHLGLMRPEEMGNVRETIEKLAEGMEKYLDIHRLLEIGKTAGPLENEWFQDRTENVRKTGMLSGFSAADLKKERVKIAIARDEAFCFYYKENMDILESMGAELAAFSPLYDEKLPDGTDGILLGGGYPELYAEKLSENTLLKQEIRKMAEKGMPIIGECGGFLYLLKELEGKNGTFYPMTGVLTGKGFRRENLNRFGYVEMTAGPFSGFLKEGETIKGHEFHYWDSTENGEIFHARKPSGGKSWDCIQRKNNVEGGFPHLYYLSSPSYAERFVEKCREFHRKSQTVCQKNGGKGQ